MNTQNILNNQCTNDFTVVNSSLIATDGTLIGPKSVLVVQKSTPGNQTTGQITNSSNTSQSDAQLLIMNGGASSGDSYVTCNQHPTYSWSFGMSSANSQAFQLSNSGYLHNGSIFFSMSQAGQLNLPGQPAFFAVQSANVINVTGDGTPYKVINDTIIFNIGSNYNNSTGIFTAPVTGKYRLSYSSWIQNVGVGTQYSAQITTTSKRYIGFAGSPLAIKDSTNNIVTSGCFLCDMIAGDVASLDINVAGQSKSIDAAGNGEPLACFQGELVQ
jgi:hypothetical protein